MIVDIPTKTDFDNNGIAFLNLAWQTVLSICLNFQEQSYQVQMGEAPLEKVHEAEEEDTWWEQAVEDYWKATQQELATAVALAQQGTEFLLKGKIAHVSPFLLITGDPRLAERLQPKRHTVCGLQDDRRPGPHSRSRHGLHPAPL